MTWINMHKASPRIVHPQQPMEQTKWTPFFLPFSIFLISFFLWHLLFEKKRSPLSRLLPSRSISTRALLFHLLFARGFFLEIGSTLRRLRDRHGSVITFGFGSMSITWVMDRHIAHKALVQQGGVFSYRLPAYEGSALVAAYCKGHLIGFGRGKLWSVLRRNLLSKALNKSNLTAFCGRRRLAIEQLVRNLHAQCQPFVFHTIFHRNLFQLIAFMCFGEDLDVEAELVKAKSGVISLGMKLYIFKIMPSIAKVVFRSTWRGFLQDRRRMEEIVVPLIDARRERVGKDLPQHCHDEAAIYYVDTLVDLEVPDEEGGTRKLSDKEIVGLCYEFIILGVHSSVRAMEWILANLIVHPNMQHRLHEEIIQVVPKGREIQEGDLAKMPYLKAVILETLRRHPPITIPLLREVSEETCIDGHAMGKGQTVVFDICDVGRDEAIWEKPSEFKPERFLEGGEGEGVDITGTREIKMVPFGAGRKLCPGMGLAMLNLQYFLACLVREFRWEAADDGQEIDMAARSAILRFMTNSLCVRISPRQ